jgi:hypothetical protein
MMLEALVVMMELRRSFACACNAGCAALVVSCLLAASPVMATTVWQQAVDQLVSQAKGPATDSYSLTQAQIDMLKNIEAEEDHLETVINMGLHNGRLSADQAAHFRGELNRLSALRASAAADRMITFPEAKQLVDMTDALIAQLTNSYEAGTPQTAFANSIPYPLYEQDRHRDILLNKILQAKNSGTISEATFTGLRSQLDATTAKMDNLRVKKGYLSLADREVLNADFNQLDSTFASSCGGN